MSASDVVHSELRIYYAKRRLPTEPFETDKILVSRFLRASLGSTFVQTAQRNASHLHQFSAWLNQRERDPIADRLNDHELDNDAREYAQQFDSTGSKKIKDQVIEALENIRQTNLPPAELTDDERLIGDFREAATSAGRSKDTVTWWVGRLHQFRTWLWSKDLTLTSLLDLPEELNRLATLSGTKRIHAALTVLQEFHAAKVEERAANFNPHRRQRLAALPAEDDALMTRFKTAAMQAGVPKNTIDSSLIHAKKFANWLHKNDKEPLASRFRDESLADDLDLYKAEGNDPENRLQSTLNHLRRLMSEGCGFEQIGPGPRLMGRHLLHPYPADARVIDAMLDEAIRGLGDATTAQKLPFQDRASRLRAFSDWLQREGKSNIVDRLNDADQRRGLNADAKNFRKVSPRLYGTDFTMLRQYLQLVEANRALGLRGPEEADSFAGEGAQHASSFQEFPSAQNTPSEGAWDCLRTQMQSSAPPSAELSSAPNTPFEGAWDWLGTQMQSSARSFAEPSSAPVTPFEGAWDWLTTQMQSSAPSSARSPSSDIYRGLSPLVDLPSTPYELRDDAHYAPGFPSTSADAQIAALNQTASFHGHGGLELGARDWLSDEHIAADYTLLIQELQRNNPDLASRTRLVDPLIAHYHLRLGSDSVAARAFQQIVYDQDGNDTADFLFLPLNDASASDPNRRGSHWSLLLVDRRERAMPAAYHYDSAVGYNDGPAALLAQRLGARLEPARMTQQSNGYDCGVFVLDGTRALVRRLAQRRRPGVLHLDNLVVDRLALQTRLRR
ncbi:hypothetical protein MPLA_680023 [Mesorhizobium sp. ORS 3359]|nr:hypothetical protein MPLA_680023 [Mesorhizobium sp. ORS 3359]